MQLPSYEPSGREFESLRARQKRQRVPIGGPFSFSALDNIRTPEFDPRNAKRSDRPTAGRPISPGVPYRTKSYVNSGVALCSLGSSMGSNLRSQQLVSGGMVMSKDRRGSPTIWLIRAKKEHRRKARLNQLKIRSVRHFR